MTTDCIVGQPYESFRVEEGGYRKPLNSDNTRARDLLRIVCDGISRALIATLPVRQR